MEQRRSKQLFDRAQQLIPGRVNSPVRAFRAVGRQPFFVERAQGPWLYDADGNRYLDYVCSWGRAFWDMHIRKWWRRYKEPAAAG